MSLIALFSDKGSPGVTTIALTLATVWKRPVVLAELDPAGGDLALRLTDTAGKPTLTGRTGLMTLAAAGRTGTPRVSEHTEALPGIPGQARLLAGVANAEQAAGLASLWPTIASALANVASADVLADLGRLQPGSPAVAVAERADVLLGVGRADAEGMLRLRDRMTQLLAALPGPALARRAAVALVGPDRRAYEAAAAMRTVLAHASLPVEFAGCVALDPGAVADLHQGRFSGRTTRSLLVRSTRGLLPTMTADFPTPSEDGRRPAAAGTR